MPIHACQCITEHQKCQDFKPLSDILKQVKSSASVQLFVKDLKDVKENLDTAIKYMKTRISTINNHKTTAVEKIRYMRKLINDYFNKLEQDILNDLESKHSKLKLDMATILQQMDQQASQINQMQSQFTIMTQYAIELQMYIGLREIEKTTSQTAKYIEDVDQDIKRPVEITLDKNGFVYIASDGNNNGLVVSPDGKTCKTILSEADGIKSPCGINISKDTGMMIVSSEISEDRTFYKTAFVYKI
ncbi:unnamed protein product [Mytilus edulis]|uniref:Uncharacterized protein n=1 Tax=Mytilus edulis TaxID=6550 RepID=A0A8S3S093_MYTED|nr:unnamed protein product [Mytilus edulis]